MPATPLRIMVIDENPQRAAALQDALRGCGYHVVGAEETHDDLSISVRRLQPDVILIDVDSPGRDTLEQITTVTREQPRPIVMFARDSEAETISAAVRAGVSAYVVDGLAAVKVQPIIDTALAQFERYRALHDELQRTRSNLEERKAVDRAKGILMTRRAMTEAEAYRALQKLAMDRKKKLGEAAQDVIDAARLLPEHTEGAR